MFDTLLRSLSLQGKITDIAIEKGKIAAIGDLAGKEAATVVECGGTLAAIPPFFNAHTHAAMTLLRSYAEDLELFDWLQNHIWPAEAKLTEEDIYVGTRLATIEMIRSGTVWFNDSYWIPKSALRAVRESGMRATLGLLYFGGPEGKLADSTRQRNEELLEAAGDDEKIRVSHTPHAIYTVPEAMLREIAAMMERDGRQVHIHVAETAKEVADCRREHNGMTPVEYLDSLGLVNERAMLAHCVHLTDHDREIIAARKAFIAHNPASNMKLCSGLFDLAKAKAAGCAVTLGTDGCASNNSLNMLEEMKIAGLTAKIQSGLSGEGNVSERLRMTTVRDLFRMATETGARFAGVNTSQFAVGEEADLLLVNLGHPILSAGYDLISDLVYAGEPEMIDSVLCHGEFLMKHRIIPGEKEVTEAARQICRSLKNR